MASLLLGVAMMNVAIDAQPILFSDFNDGRLDGAISIGSKLRSAREVDGQLELRASFPDPTNGDLNNSFGGFIWERDLSLKDGESVELRVEVYGKSPNTIVGVTSLSAAENGLYALLVGVGRISVGKLVGFAREARFIEEPFEETNSAMEISLVRTRAGNSVLLRARVSDLESGRTLFDRSFLDTSGSDPTVESSLVINNLRPDTAGLPYVKGSHGQLVIMQITDGNAGEVFARFDNFTSEFRGPEISGIRKAVQITWPKYDLDVVLEGAPTVEGPWRRILEPVNSDGPLNSVTVPIGMAGGDHLEIFRLVEP